MSVIGSAFLFLNAGCVATRYKKAAQNTPPTIWLNVVFPNSPLDAMLNTVIVFNGPGSWKRDAFWDEYVVTLRNPGEQYLIVSAANLTDYAHTIRRSRSEPWDLEKESKTLEQKYKDTGTEFARYSFPAGFILGAGYVAVTSTGYVVTWGAAGVGVGAGAGAAVATVVALPLYFGTVLTIDHYNKLAMETEFNRRLLKFPLMLAP